MRAVRRALVVGVVLVADDRRPAGELPGPPGGVEHDQLPRLVPAHDVERRGHLGRGVLRVGVVDVEPGAVGQDDVGEPEVLVGELGGVGDLPGHVEAAGVAQRRLLLEVPARPARLDRRGGVGVDHLRGRDHGVGQGLAHHRDAVLHLGAHDSSHRHGSSVRVRQCPYRGAVGWWSERVVPRMADRSLSSRPIMELRRDVCSGLSGRVLEIGFGSGLNVSAYPAQVISVSAVEPSDLGVGAVRRAPLRVSGAGRAGRTGRATPGGGGRDVRRRAVDVHAVHDPRRGDGPGGGTPGAAPRRRTARAGARPRAGPEGGRVAAPPERAPGTDRRRLPPDQRRARAGRGGRVHRRAARPGLPARARRREAVDLRVPGDRGAP